MAKSLEITTVLLALCVATQNLVSPVSASSVRQLLQNYDDTVAADSWRIDSGLEAECAGTGYPTSNWGGQTRLRHFRSNGFIVVQIRITVSVLVRGYFGERFTADSTFTFRFTDDAYNSYAANNWLWTPAQASTLVKLSDGQGNFLTVATSVTVNIRDWNIRIFEVVKIVANTCPSSGGCSGGSCGQNACGSSDCGTANAAAFAGASAGSSPGGSSGSSGSTGSSTGGSSGSNGSSGTSSGGSSGSNGSTGSSSGGSSGADDSTGSSSGGSSGSNGSSGSSSGGSSGSNGSSGSSSGGTSGSNESSGRSYG